MTKSKLDPETATVVEKVMGNLLERFEKAEEALEQCDDLPEISPETEASFLAEVESDLEATFGSKRT